MEKQLVYGVSSREISGTLEHTVYAFEDHELASRWLVQKGSDSGERQLMSRNLAIDLVDEVTVSYAEQDITRDI